MGNNKDDSVMVFLCDKTIEMLISDILKQVQKSNKVSRPPQ